MTKITRRSFLQALGAVAGIAVLPQIDIPPVPQPQISAAINISQEMLDDVQIELIAINKMGDWIEFWK